MGAAGIQLLPNPGGYEGEGINLSMRVGEGDADLLALVFKDEDVVDVVQVSQFDVSICPDLDEPPYLEDAQVGEASGVTGRVKHHLAEALGGPDPVKVATLHGRLRGLGTEGGESVLEDHDFIVGCRYLGGEALKLGGAEGAIFIRGQEGALLTLCGGDHPFLEQGVPSEF